MFLHNWTEKEKDNISVFVNALDTVELQFSSVEVINQNFALTPLNITSNIINNVTVFIINILVLVSLKNKVGHHREELV